MTISLIVLAAIVALASAAERVIVERGWRNERERLTLLAIARDPGEARALGAVRKPKQPDAEPGPGTRDIIGLS